MPQHRLIASCPLSQKSARSPKLDPRPRWKAPPGALLLIGISMYWPIRIGAANLGLLPRPWRLLLVAILGGLFAIAFAWAYNRLAGSTIGYLPAALTLIVIMFGGRINAPWRIPAVVATGLVVALAFIRDRRERIMEARTPDRDESQQAAEKASTRFPVTILAVFFLLSPLAYIRFPSGPQAVDISNGVDESIDFLEKPDVLLVVLDGYPGSIALTEVLHRDPQLGPALMQRGFDLPTMSWSSYSLTHLALPSLFQMNYPLTEGPVSSSDVRKLYQMTGGQNSVFNILKRNEYSITMFESSWLGSKCQSTVDFCRKKPLLDDMLRGTLGSSLIAPQLNTLFGGVFAPASTAAFAEAEEQMSQLAANSRPDFFYLHLLLPHPPVSFDADCSIRADVDAEVGFIGVPGESDAGRERRIAAYFEQMACVDDFTKRLVDAAGEETHVIVLSDHGSDSKGQVLTDPRSWTNAMVLERLNNFVAYKAGTSSCELDDPTILPNVFRQVFSCLSDRPITMTNVRLFKVSPSWASDGGHVYEVATDVIEGFTAAHVTSTDE